MDYPQSRAAGAEGCFLKSPAPIAHVVVLGGRMPPSTAARMGCRREIAFKKVSKQGRGRCVPVKRRTTDKTQGRGSPHVFRGRSAGVLGSSNVSTPNTPERYPNLASAQTGCAEDARTLLKQIRPSSPRSGTRPDIPVTRVPGECLMNVARLIEGVPGSSRFGK